MKRAVASNVRLLNKKKKKKQREREKEMHERATTTGAFVRGIKLIEASLETNVMTIKNRESQPR